MSNSTYCIKAGHLNIKKVQMDTQFGCETPEKSRNLIIFVHIYTISGMV